MMRLPPNYFYYSIPKPPPPSKPVVDEAYLRENLLAAIQKKDVTAARKVFDQAFDHNISLRPSAGMLFAAGMNDDREMCQLLIAYRATWSPQEASILLPLLHDGSGTKNFLRRFVPKKPPILTQTQQLSILYSMLDAFPETCPETKEYRELYENYRIAAIADAVSCKDAEEINKILSFEPEPKIDVTHLLKCKVFCDKTWPEKSDGLSFLQKMNIPLVKVDLKDIRLSFLWRDVVRSVEPLHNLGLLDIDQSSVRSTFLFNYTYALCNKSKPWEQSINYVGYRPTPNNQVVEILDLPVKILCSPHYPATENEAKEFAQQQFITHEASKNMPLFIKLCEAGYFSAHAFAKYDVPKLLGIQKNETLKTLFNHQSLLRRRKELNIQGPDLAKYYELTTAINEIESTGVLKRPDIPAPGYYKYAIDLPKPDLLQPAKKPRGTYDTGPR